MRFWIYKALCAVILDQVYSNLYLKDHLEELPETQRALATRIFYGTLQNYSYLKAIWSRYVKKEPNLKLQILLSMSVYQLLFVEKTPAYAVIDEANQIARKIQSSSAGFVNAVLRKVSRQDLPRREDELEQAALEYSVPLWLMKMWAAQYGRQQAISIAQNSNQTLPVYVRINPLKMSREEAAQNPQLEPAAGGLWTWKGGSLAGSALYQEGKISAQDEGSYAIAGMVRPEPGMRILDVCAAPGTKTLAMAEMMENTGSILALDLHEHRAKLIDSDAARLGIGIVKSEARDSTDLSGLPEFDAVLCDVPCSGYGIFSRKPDIKLRARPEDMDSLIPLQKKLLAQAAEHVRDQGALVYSTCTINKKENEKQVEAFLKDHPEFILEEESTMFPAPGQDGFYMARLKKNAGGQRLCYNESLEDGKA